VATEPAVDFALEGPAAFEEHAKREKVAGLGPWRLAFRRLGRNKTALAFGVLFLAIVALCLSAPYYANHVAHTDPFKNHLTDTVEVGGKKKNVVEPNGVPIGPTYGKRFFLGADGNGRDIAVRLLYGGRTSLVIGIGAALITALLSIVFGVVAGYFGGFTDSLISRALDLIWSFPVVLLGVALGTALALGGLKIGPVEIQGDSKLIPALIIAVVYVPYMARPIRGQVLSLFEKEFVEAARAQGAGPIRIMSTEILPNLSSTIVVFLPLLIANAMLLEAALSFLGAGVRPPNPSWGTMIGYGVDRIVTAPHLAIVPGLMVVLTVLALNVFGDGVRDALDPRAKLHLEH
jgi:peptide/nickel transport system permease protein